MFNDSAYFSHLYMGVRPAFHFPVEDPDYQNLQAVERWQNDFRARLRTALGLDAIADLLPLGFMPHAEREDQQEMDGYLRESWLLWVEPEMPLPFYLLRPTHQEGPLPLVLTPHGHNAPELYVSITRSEQEADLIRDGERDIAVQAVRAGCVAIAPTARGFGRTRFARDLAEDRLSSCRTLLMHDLLLGRTPIGDRVWDIERLIDWAVRQPLIDGSRIAITGNSGGGTTSLFAAACDPRILVAVPSSYFCTFSGSIGTIHHCECNYVPGLLTLGEMADIAGLIAPRPFCAIAGVLDDIFPIEQVRAAFEHLRQIYAAAGVPDRCRLYEGDGGHRYYKNGAWPWILEHFGKQG